MQILRRNKTWHCADTDVKVTLQPSKQGEIVWQFTKAGGVNFACLMPGHYEAGMKGAVQVGKK